MHESIPATHNAFIYVSEGTVRINADTLTEVDSGTLAVLGSGTQLSVDGISEHSRFLLIAGQKLNEPIARSGPFVMNTSAELHQAFLDYQLGQF